MINNVEDRKKVKELNKISKDFEGREIKIDIRGAINKYLQYLPLFILSICLSIIVLLLYLRYTRPVYATTINILIKEDDKKTGTDLSKQILSGLISSNKSSVANELELIQSYTLMEKVVRLLDLNTVYSSLGKVTTNEVYIRPAEKFIHFDWLKDSSKIYRADFRIQDNKVLFIQKNKTTEIVNNGYLATNDFRISVHLATRMPLNADYDFKAVWCSPMTMAKRIITKSLKVETLNRDASIMKLSIESDLPKKSTDILNTLSQEYNNASIDEKNRTTDNTIKFIDERLKLISNELGGVENKLQNFREVNNVINIEGQSQFQLDRMKDIQTTMDQLDMQEQVANMISEYVNNPERKYSLAPSSLGIEDPALLAMVKQYNEQVLNRESLLKTLAPGNIAVIGIEEQIEQLQKNIIETAKNLKKSYRTAYLKAKNDNRQIVDNMNGVPQKEKELLEISRQQGIKEKLYLFLLQKREESAITRASTISNSNPIDPAITDDKPVSPKIVRILIVAILMAFAIPITYIFIKDLLANKIITRADILNYTKAPIIGEISHHNNNSRNIVADKTRGVIPEQFRIIRANLQYFLPGFTNYSILVTSTLPGEGKTFVCMNMGAALASSGKKVALLEFDMRKPKISSALDIDHKGKGLSTYLTGNASLAEIIIPIPNVANYFLIPTGPVPPNPAELLLSPHLAQLFVELRMNFDHIVIDCPPTAIVSDAKVLANYSDLNFYIVRQRFTLKKQIEFINELYVNEIFKNMAIVVNDMILKGANGYYGYNGSAGYGNGYNYDYSYEYGYGENLKEKKGFRKWFSKG